MEIGRCGVRFTNWVKLIIFALGNTLFLVGFFYLIAFLVKEPEPLLFFQKTLIFLLVFPVLFLLLIGIYYFEKYRSDHLESLSFIITMFVGCAVIFAILGIVFAGLAERIVIFLLAVALGLVSSSFLRRFSVLGEVDFWKAFTLLILEAVVIFASIFAFVHQHVFVGL